MESLLGERGAFLPDAGQPGPVEVRLTEQISLVILDTPWWFMDPAERRALLDLQAANDGLEARVRERTAALAQREADLRLVADALPALVADIDAGERYRFANKGFERWFGHKPEEVEGRLLREVIGEAAYAVVAGHVQAALRGEPVLFRAVMPYRDGGPRHVEGQYIPHRDPDGRSAGFYAFVTDITERQRAEAALRDSEARYRALTEATAAVIWTTDADGRVDDMPQWRTLTGQTAGQCRGWGWLDALHPDDREPTRAAWRQAVDADAPYDVEYRIRAANGSYGWYNARAAAVRDEDGTVREWIGVCIDISERKAAEERQALLMAELDHRVRNILASIQAMVSLTGRSAATREDYVRALQGRVAAMARTHGLLTRHRWTGASLDRIVRDELAPYAGDGEAVALHGPADCILKPKAALSFALVIHELATNAAKYGAWSDDTGRVEIAWTREFADSAYLHFLWRERGGPPVGTPVLRFCSSVRSRSLFCAALRM